MPRRTRADPQAVIGSRLPERVRWYARSSRRFLATCLVPVLALLVAAAGAVVLAAVASC